MERLATIKIFGRAYPVPAKYAIGVMAILIPTVLGVYGYMAYLVLAVIDQYLGIGKFGVAVLLTVFMTEITLAESYGERKVALLPSWARQIITYALFVLTLVTLYLQGQTSDVGFMLLVGGYSLTSKLIEKIKAYRNRVKEDARQMASTLAHLGYGTTDVKFQEHPKK